MPRAAAFAAVWLLAILLALPAAAQTLAAPIDPLLQLGPVGVTPRLELRDFGVDSNVFNEASAPARDVVAVLVPGLDATMRVGPARVTSRTLAEWNYFQKSAGQRSVNINQQGRLDLEFTRFTPYAEGAYLRSRHRPNLEIDERVLETTRTAGVGLLVPLGARTSLDLQGRRTRVAFGETATAGPVFAARLNRVTDDIVLEGRMALSALTTLTAAARHRRERFEFESVRDSDTLAVTAGLELKPSALVSGSATAGVSRLTARHPSMPEQVDVVAAMRVSYILLEQTRFTVGVDRGVEYSFEALWPYYVSTSGSLEIKQAIGYVWDVVVRAGRSQLAYRAFLTSDATASDPHTRRDDIVTMGVGGGRHLGDDVRVGIDVTRDRRYSPVAGRSYSGYRVGGSLTYGY